MEVYKDSSQPIEKRVEDLLSKMTLEEKAAQLCGHLPYCCVEKGKVNVENSANCSHMAMAALPNSV